MTCSRENEGIVLSTVTAEPEYMGLGMNHTEPSGTLNGLPLDTIQTAQKDRGEKYKVYVRGRRVLLAGLSVPLSTGWTDNKTKSTMQKPCYLPSLS